MSRSLDERTLSVRENFQHLFGSDSAGDSVNCFGSGLPDDLEDPLAVDGLGEAAGKANNKYVAESFFYASINQLTHLFSCRPRTYRLN